MEKSSKGQQTKEKLIDAALQQFTAHGYHGTSMRQIAEAAGLAVGGIYNHFHSKEEILKAVILAYHPLTLIAPQLATTQGETLEAFLRHATRQLFAAFAERPILVNLFMVELLEFEGVHLPELFETLWPKVMLFTQRMIALEPRLQCLPPVALMRIFLGSVLGFLATGVLLSKLPIAHTQPMGTADDLITVLVHGLLASAEAQMESSQERGNEP
ncbi:MAG: TetR/AcrR family transcriptional regulator [Caldilineaceae bacterium]|nr:TetR/AcrR family transcriptional regulator [Caldilineaceae bacterium]